MAACRRRRLRHRPSRSPWPASTWSPSWWPSSWPLFIRTFVVQAFKIPTGSMEKNLLIGDHLLVNKVVYSPSLGPLEDVAAGQEARPAGPRGRLQVPRGPGPRLHQARDRPARARPSRSGTRRSTSTASRSTSRTSTSWSPPCGRSDPEYGLRGERPRDNWGPQTVPPDAALRAGRQPRQQQGQPVLGVPAPRPGEGPGPAGLLVLRGHQGGVPSHRVRGVAAGHRWPPSGRPGGAGSST